MRPESSLVPRALAEVGELGKRLAAHEAEVESWGELRDVEEETLRHLTEIRHAIASEVREAKGIDAVRAALARLFERFIVHRGGGKRVHVELAWLAEGQVVIEPVVREQAIEGYSESARPVLRREPLGQAESPGAEKYALGLSM